ncbi:hypothetical protein MCAG_03521 [Micromonospora sp. ATCC 39149]|nr:hypothetical protein MCAG_03521 [Micromonospora sp. ATCC 39149]
MLFGSHDPARLRCAADRPERTRPQCEGVPGVPGRSGAPGTSSDYQAAVLYLLPLVSCVQACIFTLLLLFVRRASV